MKTQDLGSENQWEDIGWVRFGAPSMISVPGSSQEEKWSLGTRAVLGHMLCPKKEAG